MKKLTFFFSLLTTIVFGQAHTKPQIDSLIQALKTTKQDSSRVLLMASIAEAYRTSKIDSTFYFGQEALKLSEQIKFRKGEIRALLSLSVASRNIGKFPQALELAKKEKLANEESFIHIRIANVYSDTKDYPNAIVNYHQAQSKTGNDPNVLVAPSLLLGMLYEKTNKLDSALFYGKKALAIAKNINQAFSIPDAERVIASVYNKINKDDSASIFYTESIKHLIENQNLSSLAAAYIDFAKFLQKKNEIDISIEYAQKALKIADSSNTKIQILNASSLLATLYEYKNPKASLKYYKIASIAKDCLYSVEKIMSVQNMAFEDFVAKKAN